MKEAKASRPPSRSSRTNSSVTGPMVRAALIVPLVALIMIPVIGNGFVSLDDSLVGRHNRIRRIDVMFRDVTYVDPR